MMTCPNVERALVDLVVACDRAGVDEKDRARVCKLIRESTTDDGLWSNGEQQLSCAAVLLQLSRLILQNHPI